MQNYENRGKKVAEKTKKNGQKYAIIILNFLFLPRRHQEREQTKSKIIENKRKKHGKR